MIDSWDIVLNPENLRKVLDCGVYVFDSHEEISSIGLRCIRLNADSKNAANYLPVSGMFQKLRHVIKNIIPVSIQEVWLATTFASLSDGQGTLQARNRARELGSNIKSSMSFSMRKIS
jgi:putrescine transport system substrate-binding protein